jgi:pyruvate dehydrogenase E2 component (dihydrolipoamide acetyltransferase)
MSTPVIMPRAGDGMEEGRIVRWLKKEGDAVARGEVILEIESDKSVIEVESFEQGILSRILAQADEMVPVGQPIAILEGAGGSLHLTPEPVMEVVMAPQAQTTASAAMERDAVPGPTNGKAHAAIAGRQNRSEVKASPRARKLAREHQLTLDAIPCPPGKARLEEWDVLAYLSAHGGDTASVARADREIVFTPMRRAIAQRLSRSMQTIPHYYVSMLADMTELLERRARGAQADGTKITLNDYIVRATARALTQYPRLNATWEDDRAFERAAINIGIAVPLEDGLVVPVLEHADRGSMAELAKRTRVLIEDARQGKVAGGGKGTFTVSNLGMFGVEGFTAIINPPEAAILAVGAARRQAVECDGQLTFRALMKLSLSSDHRLIDGGLAAQFLAVVREGLEHPELLFVTGQAQ